jgi:hypothetical protein
MTKGWATLKELQARKSNRERLVDPTELDADASYPVGGHGNALAEQAAKPNSTGSKLVEAAEGARQQATGVPA